MDADLTASASASASASVGGVNRPPVERAGEDPALTYFGLRNAIGLIGLALPVVLILTGAIDGHFQGSISDYYYTDVGNYFTGTMCVIGVFLVTYRFGDRQIESYVTTVAGLAALGVAFFHSAPADPTLSQRQLADVHLSCAGVLFVLLGLISFWFFAQGIDPSERKLDEARVYRLLGLIIWVSIVLMIGWNLLWTSFYDRHHVLFWLESVCVWAFSLSFVIKGQFVARTFAQVRHRKNSRATRLGI